MSRVLQCMAKGNEDDAHADQVRNKYEIEQGGRASWRKGMRGTGRLQCWGD